MLFPIATFPIAVYKFNAIEIRFRRRSITLQRDVAAESYLEGKILYLSRKPRFSSRKRKFHLISFISKNKRKIETYSSLSPNVFAGGYVTASTQVPPSPRIDLFINMSHHPRFGKARETKHLISRMCARIYRGFTQMSANVHKRREKCRLNCRRNDRTICPCCVRACGNLKSYSNHLATLESWIYRGTAVDRSVAR